ncbi:Uncharacterised protein [Serratia odorifera]|uniref:Uncharacterized protein n=1 Tax=Serratia odorifera TaxID=618 RepID=A0A3S4HUB6_SEROD|nr:hypothetical protein [Serratia odorifera]VDZ66012.1 Uncharacterised protein [Serratia odorifera]
MYSNKASTSSTPMKTGNLLIDVYGMKPDEEYNSLSNRKRYVVNQIIRQLLNKKELIMI